MALVVVVVLLVLLLLLPLVVVVRVLQWSFARTPLPLEMITISTRSS